MTRSSHLHQHLKRLTDVSSNPEAAAAVSSATPSTTTVTAATSTIAPYATELNGVNSSMDVLWQDVIWWSLGIFAMVILVIRLIEMSHKHIRHMVAMGSKKQLYWSRNNTIWWPFVKKHLIYAPLWGKRHNREFRLSSAVNIGTLPSRFHALMLGGYIFSNITYCSLLDYNVENKYIVLASLRGRSGVLAVVNMIALVLLAGRNNPLIQMLKVSFDTYNLLHRWMGRIVVLESCVHVGAWMIVKIAADGWSGVFATLSTDPFSSWGLVGVVALVLLLFTSPGFVRHAFYETFLNFHILFVAAALLGIWLHCDISNLPQLPYVQACVGLWVGDRLYRIVRILRCNYSFSRRTWTRATIEVLPGEACRVTLTLPKYIDIKAGSHAYLRFGSVSPWETHPFSVAWHKHVNTIGPILPRFNRDRSDTKDTNDTNDTLIPSDFEDELDFEKHGIPMTPLKTSLKRSQTTVASIQRKPFSKLTPPRPTTSVVTFKDRSSMTTEVNFIIHAQTGMTRKLYNLANQYPISAPLKMRASLEGPYAGHHSLDSYGHVVLFAGSSGITHQLPYLHHLLASAAEGLVATRKITLIWVLRDLEHLEWIKPFMDETLRMENRRDLCRMLLFVTRPKESVTLSSPSKSVQCFPGRPNVSMLLKKEIEAQCGAMCVTVCGPGGLADNVREAVRGVQEEAVVDFIEESFTW